MNNQDVVEDKVVKTFDCELAMQAWLANPACLDALKAEYPPSDWAAAIRLGNKQVTVRRKDSQ